MMYEDEEPPVVICPYNPEHVVRSYRFPKHLVKCKKNHPHIQLEPCFYNYCHHVKSEDMLEHFKECPEKRRIESNRSRESLIKMEKIKRMTSSNLADELLELHICLAEIKNKRAERIKKYLDRQLDDEDSDEDIFNTKQRLSTKNTEQLGTLIGEQFEENELQPLPLPKTRSKALQIKDLLFM